MKWKKDHKIPNTKSKLTEAAIARATGKSGAKKAFDPDNLDDSSNIDYEFEDGDDDEDDDEEEFEQDEQDCDIPTASKYGNRKQFKEEDHTDASEDAHRNRQQQQASYNNQMNMKPLMI
jgi:hypothetical protein